MTDRPSPPSPEEIGLFAFQVWSYKQGEMVSLLIHLGVPRGKAAGSAILVPKIADSGLDGTQYVSRPVPGEARALNARCR